MSSARFYEAADPAGRVARGDIALLYLPQTRAEGEEVPPLPEPSKKVAVPSYTGSFAVIDHQHMPGVEARMWLSLAVVVMDSCELDRFFNQGRSKKNWDSRVAVAPIVFERNFPNGPWSRMEEGDTPLYGFFMPPLPKDTDGKASWPRALVDLRGTTLVSRRLVELNRRICFGEEAREALHRKILDFWYLREIARRPNLETRRGKTIRDIVPVVLGPDFTVLRLSFDGAEPLTVGCLSD